MKQREFKSKFNHLILDDLEKHGIQCWIAGGALRDYFDKKETLTDCDLFFPNNIELEKTKNYLIKNGGKVIWESAYGLKINHDGTTYDLVKFYYQNPSQMFDNFDFTISQFATDGKILYYGDNSFEDLKKKRLVLVHVTNPLATLKKSLSHHTKGYIMDNKEIQKFYKDCFLTNPNKEIGFPKKNILNNKKENKMEEVYFNANGTEDNNENMVKQAGMGAGLAGFAIIGVLFYLLFKKVNE